MSLIKEELQTSKINLTERRIVTTDFNLDDLNDGEIIGSTAISSQFLKTLKSEAIFYDTN